MPRHVELLVYCFSPFQTRRLGECHPLDTPARVGFTKTPLSDAYASEPGLKEALADVEELDFLEDTLESGRVAIPNDGISIECDGCVAIGLGGRRVRLSCG